MRKYLKKTITFPKQYWDRIESLAEDMEAGLSDALFSLVDLGLKTLDKLEEEKYDRPESTLEEFRRRTEEEDEEEEEEE